MKDLAQQARLLYQCNGNPEHTAYDPIPARLKGREVKICPRCMDESMHLVKEPKQ